MNIIYDEQNDIIYESDWTILDTKRFDILYREIYKSFNDNNFLIQLDTELDKDREYGKWECQYDF